MINQEIFDFWNKSRAILVNCNGKYTHSYTVINGIRTIIARESNSNNDPVEYYYNDNYYTEEQMLRIIKMKAFL